MPFFLFVILVFAFDFYAFQTVQLALSEYSSNINLVVTLVYWSISFATVLFFLLGSRNSKTKRNFSLWRSAFLLVYFAKFLVVVFMLIGVIGQFLMAGISYLIPSLAFEGGRSVLSAQLTLGLVSFPFLLMIYGILRNRHRYTIYEETVPIQNLPQKLEGLKIVHISDIHSGSFTNKEPITKGIDLINQQNPDLVFFTGDLVNSVATEIEPYTDVFDKIKAKYGVFSVLGNHDYGDYVRWPSIDAKNNNLNRLKNIQKELGWQLLLNENRLVTIHGEQIAIIGVENYSAKGQFSKYGDINKAYKGSESAVLKLLLSHDPTHWEAQIINGFKEIAITFSGHTHGAQFGIEIKGLIKWSPIQYVYKHWAGLYQKGHQFLYVNRGFGYLGYPGRVGILPEITVLNLKKA